MSSLVIAGDTSGSITIQAPAVSGGTTINLPAITGGSFVVTDASGNVNIGSTSSLGKLTISNNRGGQYGRFVFDANVSSGYTAYFNITDVGIEYNTDSTIRPYIFKVNNTEKIRIQPSGYMGIGTNSPGANLHVVGTAYSSTQTLTDGATISWDTTLGQTAIVLLGGNRAMATPTGLVNGGFYSLAIAQDGTGSRTLTWSSNYRFVSNTAPTLTTTAGAKDFITFRSDGTNLYEQGRSLGVF